MSQDGLTGLTLCDFEVQQLREMFPDCSEDVVKEASGKYATLESAIDFIIDNSVKTIYMYTGILLLSGVDLLKGLVAFSWKRYKINVKLFNNSP